ncbi:MAG TPA: carbohydrate-binding protein [Gammaproteobacteria bacterium]|nr:carbohydrate-binding protein [Gammaproteobacteria bacterium]
MRKRIVGSGPTPGESGTGPWLDLEALAVAEVTSEDPEHPVEGALVAGDGRGWRAAQPGPQTLRLVFDRPQQLGRVRVVCEEPERERTQELFLGWAPKPDDEPRQIVRQQWNFNAGARREVEELTVDLSGVGMLELYLVPEIGGGEGVASVTELRLGPRE